MKIHTLVAGVAFMGIITCASCSDEDENPRGNEQAGMALLQSVTLRVNGNDRTVNFYPNESASSQARILLTDKEEYPSTVTVSQALFAEGSKEAVGIAPGQTLQVDGDNRITIRVVSRDGQNQRDYTIGIEKRMIELLNLGYGSAGVQDTILTKIEFLHATDTTVNLSPGVVKLGTVKVRMVTLKPGVTGLEPYQILPLDADGNVSFTLTDDRGVSRQYTVRYSMFEKVYDIEGNAYNTVKIGNQVWMAQNLKATRLNDGTPIDKTLENAAWAKSRVPAYCYYANSHNYIDGGNYLILGANVYIPAVGLHYNWYAVSSGKLCPKGFHVPTRGEYEEMFRYITSKGWGYSGYDKDIAMTLAATSTRAWYGQGRNETAEPGSPAIFSWDNPVMAARRNVTRFEAIAGGVRIYNGVYNDGCPDNGNGGFGAYFWTSTRANNEQAEAMYISNFSKWVHNDGFNFAYGLNVRCIKD